MPSPPVNRKFSAGTMGDSEKRSPSVAGSCGNGTPSRAVAACRSSTADRRTNSARPRAGPSRFMQHCLRHGRGFDDRFPGYDRTFNAARDPGLARIAPFPVPLPAGTSVAQRISPSTYRLAEASISAMTVTPEPMDEKAGRLSELNRTAIPSFRDGLDFENIAICFQQGPGVHRAAVYAHFIV